MFLYRDILKKSLSITFSHKNLWFFGIFAALVGGVGQYTMSFSQATEDWTTNVFSALALFFGQNANGNIFADLVRLFKSDLVSALIFSAFILIVIVVSLFLLWLAIVSQGGLVNNSARIIKANGKREIVPIRDGLDEGIAKFWPILGFDLITAALTCFFAALVGLPLVFMTAAAGGSIFFLYVLLFMIFIPLALIISFVTRYAINYSVIKNRKFIDAFLDAWRLFGKYWLVSIEMALILFMIDFLFVFVLALLILVLAIPYLFLARILSLAFFVALGAGNFSQIALTAGLFLALIIIILGGAVITVFKTVAWTDIFINLVDKKGGLAKLERLAAGFKKNN
ncbi:MAG TPA: hypothetical protein VMC41_00750 [Candidatus Nanoarchaeia archaeon]|nr:hypothetical protein [Candidatus Nanoarchaeia archaeon]